MLSTTEQVSVLRVVSLFAAMPGELLAELAGLLDEVAVGAGEAIITEGEPGASLFIIVEGRVRVHRGGRPLNELGPSTVFGEMSALDPEPRSASVTAIEATRLLRLEQAVLSRLMERRPEVAGSIIRILCQHLRARLAEMVDDYHYQQQVAQLTTAAAAVEAGVYEPDGVDEVARRTDPLGQLARVLQRMIREVDTRERHLQQQVQALRIEVDKVRQAHKVAEITGTEYFQHLRTRANELRNLFEQPEE